MFAIVFGCLLALQGVRSSYFFPASWNHVEPQNATFEILNATQDVNNETHYGPTAKMYFANFDLKKLNPVYWFYDSSKDDKIDELYSLVKCLIEEEPKLCQKKLQTTRKLFEKKKKGEKDQKKKHPTEQKENSTHNEDSTTTHKAQTSTGKPMHWRKSTTYKPMNLENRFQSETSSSSVKPVPSTVEPIPPQEVQDDSTISS